MEEAMPPGIYESMVQMVRANWPLAARTLADFGGRSFGDEPLGLGEACVQSASSDSVADILAANRCADAGPVLSRISCPVLVLANDGILPHAIASAQKLAAALPNARMKVLGKQAWVQHPEALDEPFTTIVNFLAEHEPSVQRFIASAGSSAFRTVLFTDLVGHTEMMSRLGDERGRAVLREHERITRDVLKAHGGTEVKTMGDGFMASFGSVTKAVECAIALQRAFAEREGEPFSVRVGLNAGEPIEEDGDLFGATVIMASRIAAKAGAGEILVADTVRGLCSGKGFLFADRGEFVAKGFEEPVRVYEVSWRG
jgi:class 3 adenylate cyclase